MASLRLYISQNVKRDFRHCRSKIRLHFQCKLILISIFVQADLDLLFSPLTLHQFETPLPHFQTTNYYSGPSWKCLQMDKMSVSQVRIPFFVCSGRKHCGKRRKCWSPSFSPIPQCFQGPS